MNALHTPEQDLAFKREIKAWAKAHNKSYAEIAAACYVSEATFRNWMARKTIPVAKAHILSDLINSNGSNKSLQQRTRALLLDLEAQFPGLPVQEQIIKALL